MLDIGSGSGTDTLIASLLAGERGLELWMVLDMLTMLSQLGVVPPMG